MKIRTITDRERTATLGAQLSREAAALRTGPPIPTQAWRELRLAEVRGSLAAAGIAFTSREVARLVESGLAPAGRPLELCNAVADYAAAAVHVLAIGRSRPHRGLVRLEDVIALHALATRRSSRDRPGKWRTQTVPALVSGVVPPPAWSVPRSMSAFVERFEGGPSADRPLLAWLADFYERFVRVHPFATANNRVARLLVNLVLQRLGFPPVVLLRADAKTLSATLGRASAGEVWPSARFFGQNVMRTVRALEFSRARPGEALVPLGRIGAPEDAPSLYKAAQRGRLRTVRKGTGIFTSKTWLTEYRNSLAPAGRPRRRP